MTNEERQRWRRMKEKREQSLGSAFATKIDLERAMRASAVDGEGLEAAIRQSNEDGLAEIMATAEKDAARARIKADRARSGDAD